MDKLDDQWNDRDYPVLREIARRIDSDPRRRGVSLGEIALETKISNDRTLLAAQALDDDGLVKVHWAGGSGIESLVAGISAEARRLVGLWPSPETGMERMIAALEAIAANTSDEDTRTRAQKLLDGFKSAGRELTLAAGRAFITGQIPT
jgi:hypothetical protein